MKIKTTKKMAKFLNNNIKNVFKGVEIVQMKYTPNEYFKKVDCYDIPDYKHDYDQKTKKFNLIVVYYPFDCALPQYFTTDDLVKMYKESDGTADGFLKIAKKYIEI